MKHRLGVAALAAVTMLWPLAADAAPLLGGLVKTPLTLDQATLEALPKTSLDVSFETATGKESGSYTGVLLADLVAKAEPIVGDGKNAALQHTLLITGTDGYAVAVAFGEFDAKFGAKAVLLAYKSAGGDVTFEHLRLLVPGDIHGGRAVKDVASIDVK